MMIPERSLWVALVVLVGCAARPEQPESIKQVQQRHEAWLMSLPGVVGVGVGTTDGAPSLKVFVAERTPELERQVPTRLDGYEVELEVTGPIQIQPAQPGGT